MSELARGTHTKAFQTPKKTRYSIQVDEADNGYVVTKRDEMDYENQPIKHIAKDKKAVKKVIDGMIS